MNSAGSNWAGNVVFGASRYARPASLDALRATVTGSRAPCRVVGAGHSFNRLADTTGTLLDLAPFDEIDLVGPEGGSSPRRVRVGGGVRYAELAVALHERGWALPNLASLTHITVAGGVATSTHGSGDGNGHLGTSVVAVEILDAHGEIVRIERGDAAFGGAVVSLGALGAMVALELEVEPTFDVAQEVWTNLELEPALEHLDGLFSSAYSVSWFTCWTRIDQMWCKWRLDAGPSDEIDSNLLGAVGAAPASGAVHPVVGMDPAPCTTQGGVPGPWHRRLPHFRPEHTPSAGDELQSELFVDRAVGAEALRAVASIAPVLAPVLLVSEVRTLAGDGAWLSPTRGVDTLGIHFTWRPDEQAVRRALAAVEEVLTPFEPRPHWGKLTIRALDRTLEAYPSDAIARFEALRDAMDPDRRWSNAHLRSLFGS